MVRKDGDTMKECMKTNNPTEFRNSKNDVDVLFNKAMDAYENSEHIYENEGRIIGIDLANGPDMTSDPTDFKECLKNFPSPDKNPCVKEEFEYDTQRGICWYAARVVNTTYSVNLRSEPNLDSAVMAHIHPDSEFLMSATRSPDWYKVRLKDGTEGFASSKFVSRVMPDEHT